jgi:hypothetical protein
VGAGWCCRWFNGAAKHADRSTAVNCSNAEAGQFLPVAAMHQTREAAQGIAWLVLTDLQEQQVRASTHPAHSRIQRGHCCRTYVSHLFSVHRLIIQHNPDQLCDIFMHPLQDHVAHQLLTASESTAGDREVRCLLGLHPSCVCMTGWLQLT